MCKLDLLQYLAPLNISDEKNNFFSKIAKGEVYNPHFEYKKFSFDESDTIKELEKIKKDFSALKHPLSSHYEKTIYKEIQLIQNMSDRSLKSYPMWLSNIYGYPSDDDFNYALNLLREIEPNDILNIEYDIQAETLKRKIQTHLKALNIEEWKISLENVSARISVSTVTKTIAIKIDTLFEHNEIQRLFLHEIGVHVIRHENGLKQKYLLFSKGFPDFMETEEGLAIFAEKRNKLLSNIALAKYCCRLIAAYVSKYNDFYNIFKKISKYINDSDAFDIVMRIKRGLVDTGQIGGFTKDQVYLSGLRKIELQPIDTIRKLFIGKVGLNDLDVVNLLPINYNVNYPKWLNRKWYI